MTTAIDVGELEDIKLDHVAERLLVGQYLPAMQEAAASFTGAAMPITGKQRSETFGAQFLQVYNLRWRVARKVVTIVR